MHICRHYGIIPGLLGFKPDGTLPHLALVVVEVYEQMGRHHTHRSATLDAVPGLKE